MLKAAMNMKKKLPLLLIGLFVISACGYEDSPWSEDVDCPTSVSVDFNLKRLKAQEEREGVKTSYKVALVSDPQMYPGAFEDVIKRINGMDDVAFILLSGDLAHGGIKHEFQWTCKGMSASNKPIFAVVGNHDAISFGKDIWLKYFGPFNYSFSYQGSKFVAYNDNKYEFGTGVPDRDWLKEQVDTSTPYLNVAVSHIPPWSEDRDLSKFMKDEGYDLALHGHEGDFDYRYYTGMDLPHFITFMSKYRQYGMLTIDGDTFSLEKCDEGICTTMTAREDPP